MARRNRFAPPGYWLHITQRGNYRQTVFSHDSDRLKFLDLIETYSTERGVRIAAYALMSNHFHLVAAGDRPDAVSLFMMNLNGFYSAYRHGTERRRGRLWQGRFFSCVLEDAHWATALRYVELNPVRARMVARAEDAPWTSARIHLGLEPAPPWLDTERFQARWPTPGHWRESLETLTYAEAAALRQATRHETALGSDSFINELEARYGVQLRAKPLGRPRKPASAEPSLTHEPATALHAG
jgi:putative transposase